VVIATFWIGIDAIVQRYSLLLGEDAVLREGRIIVFRNTVKMISAYPAGIGTGNFLDRFREFQTFQPNLLFDHAHNEYLETAAEWGMPLAALFWAGIIFALVRAVRLFRTIEMLEQQGVLLACVGGTFSILIHGLADFNLEIPSNAMLFFTFVGILFAMTNDQSQRKIHERWHSESRAS
jgi:O-antigen ligase